MDTKTRVFRRFLAFLMRQNNNRHISNENSNYIAFNKIRLISRVNPPPHESKTGLICSANYFVYRHEAQTSRKDEDTYGIGIEAERLNVFCVISTRNQE